MLSIAKLLVLAIVIVVVWFGWNWMKRVEAVGRVRRAHAPRRSPGPGHGPGPSPGPTRPPSPPDRFAEAEDMEKCPECGAYVAPRSATSCGRSGCPYGN